MEKTNSTLGTLFSQIMKGNNGDILNSDDTLFLLQMTVSESNVKSPEWSRFSKSENKNIKFSDMEITHLLNATRKTMQAKTEKALLSDKMFSGMILELSEKVCQNIKLVEADRIYTLSNQDGTRQAIDNLDKQGQDLLSAIAQL
jgi:uncharacterized tellurite resistance protein B-like protein